MKSLKLLVLSAAATLITSFAGAAQINTYGKMEIVADDKSFSARLTGRVYMDGNFYRSDSEDRHLTSGMFIRSARIGVTGNFREWDYAVEYDNATDVPSLKDAHLRRNVGPGDLTMGQFKIRESIGEITSENDPAFMERAYVSEAMPGYKIGLGYNGTVSHFGYSSDVYNLREASDGGSRATNNGVGVTVRAYFAPINNKTSAVHLGTSYAHENTDVDGSVTLLRPAGRADDYRSGEPFRFTLYDRQEGRADVNRMILEGNAINGPLWVQGEFLMGDAKTKVQSTDTYTAWYVQASYFLTGEIRRYDFQTGEIQRPKEPNRTAGAVEIAARYQQANRKKVSGAQLTDADFGITYYANMNVRYMLNYSLPNNKLINDQPRLIAMRAQFDF